MTRIRLEWKESSPESWQQSFDKIPRSNIFQDWHIGQAIAMAEGFQLRRAHILRAEKPIGLLQVFKKRHWFGAKSIRLIRGPLFHAPPATQEMIDCLAQVKQRFPLLRGHWTTLLPELPDTEATQKVLSGAGLNRILTGYQTCWLDLRLPLDQLRNNLHPKWRNQLSKAEKSDLVVIESNDESWLLEQHADHRERSGFTALAAAAYPQIPAAQKQCLTALQDGIPIAGLLLLRHGWSATYQIGWSSEAGKRWNATNLLLWKAIECLSAQGMSGLDLGGIDPIKTPGLARFKTRMNGETITLAGTYL